MKGRYLISTAVAAFLLFAATGVYRILFPVHHWNVDCLITHNGQKVFAPTYIAPKERVAEDFAAMAEKRGEICTVIPVNAFRYGDYFRTP